MAKKACTRGFVAALLLTGAIFLFGWQASAWGQTATIEAARGTILEWFDKNKDAKPEFKPGDVLTHADLEEKVRPFVFPPYFGLLQRWKDIKMEVVESRRLIPHKDYLACTEKYQRQVRLAEDGSLENYVCGEPFPTAELDPKDPLSGLKAAWNQEKRYYYRGLFILTGHANWVRPGKSHVIPEPEMPPAGWAGGEIEIKPGDWPVDTAKIYGGGGTFQRRMGFFYHKAYYSFLPMFPENNYMLPGSPEAGEVFFKEFTGFFSPFDVRGTAFIVKRYTDPRHTDDGWAYVPAIRRVRRISAEVKSDALMGTEHNLDDFYGFNGRPLDYDWKFWGFKDMLCVYDKTKWDDDILHAGGPNGWLIDDVWQIRKMAILERFPHDPRHPYSSVIMAFDADTWEIMMMMMLDRKERVWKISQWGVQWSEDAKRFTGINHGRHSIHWRMGSAWDIQNERADLWIGYVNGLPDFSSRYVTELYDLNRLTEMHR